MHKAAGRRLFLRIGYFNSIGGVSGDMLLGALVGAGLPLDALRQELEKLNVDGYYLAETTVNKNGVTATLLTVDTSMYSSMHKPHTIEDFLNIADGHPCAGPLNRTDGSKRHKSQHHNQPCDVKHSWIHDRGS